jgi:hypothetical protein
MTSQRDPAKAGGISRRRGMIRKRALLLGAVLLGAMPSASGVLAANAPVAATHNQSRVHRGGGVSLYNQAPSMPPPVFNPSTPYTAPTTPEVPVSPASPGSVFGNGP